MKILSFIPLSLSSQFLIPLHHFIPQSLIPPSLSSFNLFTPPSLSSLHLFTPSTLPSLHLFTPPSLSSLHFLSHLSHPSISHHSLFYLFTPPSLFLHPSIYLTTLSLHLSIFSSLPSCFFIVPLLKSP